MGIKSKKKARAVDPLAATATEDQVNDELPVEAQAAVASSPQIDVQGAVEAKSGPKPDASYLIANNFPARAAPAVIGSREQYFQVIFRQSVLDQIHRHGKAHPQVEVCGVLVGDIFHDAQGPYAYVQAAIQGNDAVNKQTQVTITSQTWSRIHETLEKEHPDKRIVGWYHTHPGFGIFLSGMDLFIQDNFFNEPWQVAFVHDPLGGDEGVFVWRDGAATREPHLIEDDTGEAHPPGGFAGASAVAELNHRIAALENRLGWLMCGLFLLLVIALLWPLMFLEFFPQKVRNMIQEEPVVAPDNSSSSQKKPPKQSGLVNPGTNHSKMLAAASLRGIDDGVVTSTRTAARRRIPAGRL
jgi:proteasome lid subunit RPN8/RPN11